MQIKFNDTPVGNQQDYLCAVLSSLSSLAEAHRRYCSAEGVIRSVYHQEIIFHHELAVKTILRVLSFNLNRTLVTEHNLERFWRDGLRGFEDFLIEYEDEFDTEK